MNAIFPWLVWIEVPLSVADRSLPDSCVMSIVSLRLDRSLTAYPARYHEEVILICFRRLLAHILPAVNWR